MEIPLAEYRFDREIGGADHFEFYDDTLDDRFLGIMKREEDMYSLQAREGFLRLYTRREMIGKKEHPAYLGVRQKSYSFAVSCGVDFVPQTEDETAGIVLFQNHANHLRIEVLRGSSGRAVRATACIKGTDQILTECPLATDGLLEIELCAADQEAQVFVKERGRRVEIADRIDLLPYTTEEAGGFVGCTVGMYTSSNGKESDNHADFAWFHYDNR